MFCEKEEEEEEQDTASSPPLVPSLPPFLDLNGSAMILAHHIGSFHGSCRRKHSRANTSSSPFWIGVPVRAHLYTDGGKEEGREGD